MYKGADRRMNNGTDFKFEIQQVFNEIEGMSSEMKVMKANSKDIKKDVCDMKKVLLGNGKIGIFSKVQILWGSSIFVVSAVVVLLIREFLLK